MGGAGAGTDAEMGDAENSGAVDAGKTTGTENGGVGGRASAGCGRGTPGVAPTALVCLGTPIPCVPSVAAVAASSVARHAIDATPAGWRSGAGSSPLNGPSTAASSPRNDLVNNYRVHPMHRLNFTQAGTPELSPRPPY